MSKLSKWWAGLFDCLLAKQNEKIVFKKEKTMKKSDLKLGNIIELKDSKRYLLIETPSMGKMFITNEEWMCYDNVTENLEHVTGTKINKVYGGCIFGSGLGGTLKHPGELLWKRNEITELTLEDVAKKFNIDVKNLRIKD